AEGLLAAGGIRDVVFEDHGGYPTNVSRLLERHGFRVFALRVSFWGPRLEPAGAATPDASWEAPNYLATREPDRALARVAPRGWRVLRRSLL
ncbi:MAG: FkbM family methyltransferase, partial [Gemmatimonadota bacterium]|nr:FkbM family methyltransferase [Gemmatimonadota bacterium]